MYLNLYTFIYLCIVNEEKDTCKTGDAAEGTLSRDWIYFIYLIQIYMLHLYTIIYLFDRDGYKMGDM